ncbi:MAG TPA: HAD-IA family hydrolase [Bryobacteraceae bacterium]|nr:HAD-IA family hydrolase [Bryobacteraceae bacterium]
MSTSAQVLVFDMDGVLVDVTESYRETVVQTVAHFTGKTIARESIQDYKNQGGWNNDWALSQKICSDLGVEVSYDEVVRYFNHLFLDQGMIHRERWLPRDGLLDRLASKFELAIYTGRTRQEVEITLKREGLLDRFLILTADDVQRAKPAPDGLWKIAALRPKQKLLYVGDTVDDARCARAAEVPFIGIAAPDSPRRDQLLDLFQQEGAIQVLREINEIG